MDVWCAIRTYPDHATELGNVSPKEPVFFIKPTSSLVDFGEIDVSLGDIHHEVELVIKLGTDLKPVEMTVGLDLTRRSVQDNLKKSRLPWTEAKGFKNSAVIGDWVEYDSSASVTLDINDKRVQDGSLEEMTWPIDKLIEKLSRWAPLTSGDILFTGTPAGVGVLRHGDVLRASLYVKNKLILEHHANII